jgi:hypothetical protein
MSFDDYWKKFTGQDLNFSDVDGGSILGGLGGALVANQLEKYTQVQKPPVGYQGTVPRLTAVRERVNRPFGRTAGARTGILTTNPEIERTKVNPEYDPVTNPDVPERIPRTDEDIASKQLMGDRYQKDYERRPGSAGRRYFSDLTFAKTPEEDLKPPTLEEAKDKAKRQALELEGKSAEEIETIMNPPAPEDTSGMAMGGSVQKYAAGGIAGAHKGYYLGGSTDGMADKVPASIDGKQEARLSDGEFVIPADVVSHLGNGNSDAGAQQLHKMMDGVRTARTGNPEQGKQIDPQKFMPKMAQGGIAEYAGGGSVYKNQPFRTNFQTAGPVVGDGVDTETPVTPDPVGEGEIAGSEIGTTESLANWAGDYVTNMLGQGRAIGESPYEAYYGPLTAGSSALQDSAFTGIMQLNNPLAANNVIDQMGAFQPTQAAIDPYMNPFTQNVIDRTAADMRRQDQINQAQQRQQLVAAGAFGGSRDALLRSEAASNLNRNIGDMSAELRMQGFESAMDRAKGAQEMANVYGFDVLDAQGAAGQAQRDIASEGIAADYEQFREERDYPYRNIQFMQSLLQALPIEAQASVYSEPSQLREYFDTMGGLEAVMKYLGATDKEPEQEATAPAPDNNNANPLGRQSPI